MNSFDTQVHWIECSNVCCLVYSYLDTVNKIDTGWAAAVAYTCNQISLQEHTLNTKQIHVKTVLQVRVLNPQLLDPKGLEQYILGQAGKGTQWKDIVQGAIASSTGGTPCMQDKWLARNFGSPGNRQQGMIS